MSKTIRCSGKKNDGTGCTREKQFDKDNIPDHWRCWQHHKEEDKEVEMTEQQKVFADEYIISLNATDAAIKAGYSENTARQQGSRLLSNVNIEKYIQKRLEEKEAARIATQDEVLEYLTKVMRGEIDEEQVVVESVGDYMSAARTVSKKVGAKDRNKAAELLGKRYSLFKENMEIDLHAGVEIIDDIE